MGVNVRRLRWRVLRFGTRAVAAIVTIGVAFAAEPAGEVVARLGTTDFTAADLRAFVHSLDANTRRQAATDPAAMDRLVHLEMARIATLKEAKAKKWDQRPEVVAEIERARDATIVNSFLLSVSAPPSDFPSETDIQKAYDNNRDRFMVARQYQISQILVSVPPGADKKAEDAAEKEAENFSHQLNSKGANFGEIARTNSDDKDSAAKGGDLGWVPETELLPQVRSQLAGMSNGEISAPIRVPAGWVLVRMADTRPAAPRPLAEVKSALIAYMRQAKTQENEQAYLNGLLEKSPVVLNEIGLKKLFESVE